MPKGMTYRDAGVNIEAGEALVERIKPLVAKTMRPGVLSQLGGFGANFELPQGYKQPVLVSCTDGAGTKLRIAIEMNRHRSIGIDCVAMCVNDCVVGGAEPLWFLDYFATSHLDVDQAEQVIQGIAAGCLASGVSLIGGETAEMPDMYQPGDYDIAGFCVGIVEKSKMITGQDIVAGDVLIALPSSGMHSNGYSLVRKLLQMHNLSLTQPFGPSTLGEQLLIPTRLYVHQTLALARADLLKGAAHITGGGITENVVRFLPPQVQAVINLSSFKLSPLFSWIQQLGAMNEAEMLKTFNCGAGMIYCVEAAKVDESLQLLTSLGETPWIIGSVQDSDLHSIKYVGTLS